ncbi:Hypothetical protein ING2D1G_1334 [Peptoniphilus sp. ING2-D1G]|nr:Hypothetical protein ING2D1G_1334 [Peptoniphilus sp. ING2-D1G]
MELKKISSQHREEMMEKADLLKALGHPIRLCILENLVLHGEKNVTEIVSCMDASQSNISQHLSKLRDMGIVTSEKDGNQVYYFCTNEEVRRLVEYLFGGNEEK